MKKVLVFLSLAAIALVSCQKEVSVKDEASPKATRTFKCVIVSPEDIVTAANPDSRVAIDLSNGKTTWEAGDEIHIHTAHIRDGEYATVTLTAEDISADGKTATITFPELKLYDYEGNGFGSGCSNYYAAYPASATNNPGSCYNRNYFGDTNKPLMAAYSDDENDTFVFYNLCGLITFSVSGEFDNFVFSGNNDETVGYDNYVVELLAASQNFLKSSTSDPKKVIAGDVEPDGSTIHYIYLPNGADFTAGFTFKFKDGSEVVKAAINNNPVTVGRGQILNLGNITSKLVDYSAPTVDPHESAIPTAGAVDLSAANGPANCYVLTAPGTYKLPALKGCSNIPAGNVWGIELLWETYNNAESVTANSVIAAVDYENNWIYFQTPETLKAGNAVIAAKDSEGKIIWSWHIWIPATAIATDTYNLFNKAMMDRYLGALVAATVDSVPVESYGLTYQWGRKDPFVGPGDVATEGNATVAGKACSAGAALASVQESIERPTYIGSTADADWLTTPDNTLWVDDSKSIYDPCPPGYRVPARDKSQPLFGVTVVEEVETSNLSTVVGWSENAAAHYFTLGDPVTVFPFAGYRDDYGPGKVAKVGARVAIWTAHNDGDKKGYILNVRAGSSHELGSTPKGRGGSIRCVEE